MNHCIIVKFNESVQDKGAVTAQVESHFEKAKSVEGVTGVSIYKNCIDRANRYDLMIELSMEKSALENWDNSAVHKEWKEKFSGLLEKKAIFDWE